jgi:hypothetical protein
VHSVQNLGSEIHHVVRLRFHHGHASADNDDFVVPYKQRRIARKGQRSNVWTESNAITARKGNKHENHPSSPRLDGEGTLPKQLQTIIWRKPGNGYSRSPCGSAPVCDSWTLFIQGTAKLHRQQGEDASKGEKVGLSNAIHSETRATMVT